jgi:hypothetical protein
MVGWMFLTAAAWSLRHVMLPTNSLQEEVNTEQTRAQISRFSSFNWWQRHHLFPKMSVYIAKTSEQCSVCHFNILPCIIRIFFDRTCMVYLQKWHNYFLRLPVVCSLYSYNCTVCLLKTSFLEKEQRVGIVAITSTDFLLYVPTHMYLTKRYIICSPCSSVLDISKPVYMLYLEHVLNAITLVCISFVLVLHFVFCIHL